jgi:hypothetical protein
MKGRKLADRTGVQGSYFFAQECRDNDVSVDVIVSLEAPKEVIIQKTTEAIQELGRAFGEYLFPEQVVEKQVNVYLNQMQIV